MDVLGLKDTGIRDHLPPLSLSHLCLCLSQLHSLLIDWLLYHGSMVAYNSRTLYHISGEFLPFFSPNLKMQKGFDWVNVSQMPVTRMTNHANTVRFCNWPELLQGVEVLEDGSAHQNS